MIDMPASPGAPCRETEQRKRGETRRGKHKDNYIPVKTGVKWGCLRWETFRAYGAAAVLASPSSCLTLWEKRCLLEVLRCARKWKLHSKEKYKHIKHFLAKHRFCPIESVKDGLKPFLFPSCEFQEDCVLQKKEKKEGCAGLQGNRSCGQPSHQHTL